MPNRQRVTKSEPEVMEQLATELRCLVEDLSGNLVQLFLGYREGRVGADVRSITIHLFARWCVESGTPPLPRIIDEISSRRRAGTASAIELSRFFVDRGFPTSVAPEVADAVAAAVMRAEPTGSEIESLCWPLYEDAIKKLCVQTAHVLVARMLFYRVGEDGAGLPIRASGAALASAFGPGRESLSPQVPAVSLFERFRSEQESFLPILYALGEFDWWMIIADKRSSLKPRERAAVAPLDRQLDLAFQRCLRCLDRFQFAEMDVDIWRNIYQHYLPWEERQRLGGFYTPEELVELVLDEVGYNIDDPDLATKTLIDPASGSGAFLVGALSRLLKNLSKFGPPEMPVGRQPPWVRAEHELRAVQKCLHAVDIHPFAAFLSTLNVLFLVLPRYRAVRLKNLQFAFEPAIMAHDSLFLTAAEVKLAGTLQEQLNGRAQRAGEDQRRYAELLKNKFDFVVGNPPWSGILKGPLAAVYDELQKRRLKDSFPASARGKYDIYGLFMERALRFLKPGARFGLVTQDTYTEKEWAGTLRGKLSRDTTILTIIDLNPCGQLFFRAMNTPAITVVANEKASKSHEALVAVVRKPTGFENLTEQGRRIKVLRLVQSALAGARKSKRATVEFVDGFRKPQADFARAGTGRWSLAPSPPATGASRLRWLNLGQLFDTAQGVTPGGEGCLDLFLLEAGQAAAAGLEPDLLHPVVKGTDIGRYRCRRTGNVILYPYVLRNDSARRAFDLAVWKAKQRSPLPQGVGSLTDALDFATAVDIQEEKYRNGQELNQDVLRKLLNHRRGLGIVEYPNAAAYLVSHYGTLAKRVFEKRRIAAWGKQWYEYHRPRDITAMLRKPKLLSPRLTPKVRFALDRQGIVPQDSCIALVTTKKQGVPWQDFTNQISKALGRRAAALEALQVALAFGNSRYAQDILVTGRRPTPKGSYQITDEFLKEVEIPPLGKAKCIASLVKDVAVLCGRETAGFEAAQKRIDSAVRNLVDSAE
jgi:hypothetical protein